MVTKVSREVFHGVLEGTYDKELGTREYARLRRTSVRILDTDESLYN